MSFTDTRTMEVVRTYWGVAWKVAAVVLFACGGFFTLWANANYASKEAVEAMRENQIAIRQQLAVLEKDNEHLMAAVKYATDEITDTNRYLRNMSHATR